MIVQVLQNPQKDMHILERTLTCNMNVHDGHLLPDPVHVHLQQFQGHHDSQRRLKIGESWLASVARIWQLCVLHAAQTNLKLVLNVQLDYSENGSCSHHTNIQIHIHT